MKQIDDSIKTLADYRSNHVEYQKHDLSESDTRSKLIDRLLIDVLGWDEKDIKREGSIDSGYYDYKISIPGVQFIVEAKKQFKEFVLPSHHKRVTLKSLLKENEVVIKQIRNYAIDEGIQYCIITNGTQLLLFKAFNSDGKDWKENIALIFKSLDDIQNRFVEFFEAFSKFSILKNGGFIFDLPIKEIQGKTILSSITDKDKELIRNSLSATLAPLIDQVFGEMFSEGKEDDINFIKKCFVENEETKKNKSEIERLFNDKAPELKNVIPIVNSNNLANKVVEDITNEEISIKNAHPPNPTIIIGSKGAGKTTFINHLFKHRVKAEDIEHHYVIYIDFRNFYETDSFFEPKRIAQEILEKIYTKYEELELHSMSVLKRIYFKEIRRNDEGTWEWDKSNDQQNYQSRLSRFLEEQQSDPFQHLALLSKYLIRERRKRLVVIIDNADQFKDIIQEKIFTFSHSLTRSSLCGVVISLREGYYRKWQNTPPFDAYESNVYHITAPRYVEVLQKRIDFAIEKLKQKEETYTITVGQGRTAKISSSYVVEFLEGLKYSLLTIENSALLEFLNMTTFPNIREGLKIFKIFLNSGHTKVTEYIQREVQRTSENKTHPIIPLHEFIKSLALQNRHYYNSESSVIYNVFTPPIDSTDHFIKIYLLHELLGFSEKEGYQDKFVKSETILEKFVSLGYRPNVINSALSSLLQASLIDTDDQLSDIEWMEMPSDLSICLTAKGFYYVKSLINRFLYTDLVAQDTVIFDEKAYTEMLQIFPRSNAEGTRNFELRKEFAGKFVEYLNNMHINQASKVKHVFESLITEILRNISEEMGRV